MDSPDTPLRSLNSTGIVQLWEAVIPKSGGWAGSRLVGGWGGRQGRRGWASGGPAQSL